MKKQDIKQPKTIEELFNYLKMLPFLVDYSGVNPNNGIRGRKVGKGTNKNDKKTSFTNKDLQDIKKGWDGFIADFQPVINSIEDGN